MTLSELAVKVSIKGAEQVKRSVLEVRDAMQSAAKSAGELAQKAKPVGDAFLSIVRAGASAAVSLVGVQSAMFAVAGAAGFEAAKNMDGLIRGLASVSMNAEDLRGQLGRLKEVAKLPGLGFAEAVQGSLALQSTGLSADLAERSLKAFGNALASVGKGKADLDGVSLALQQMASKGKVSAEELNQLSERTPQVRAAVMAAFGTTDGQELEKLGIDTTTFITGLVTQLEKLPQVTGGVGNAIENLQDRLQAALLPLGKGLVAMFEGAAPSIEKLLGKIEDRFTAIGEVLAAVGKSGVLAETLEKILGLTGEFSKGDFQAGFTKIISGILTAVGNLPTAIDKVKSYLGDLFAVIGANAVEVGRFVGERLSEIWGRLSDFAKIVYQGTKDTFLALVDPLGVFFSSLADGLAIIAPAVSSALRAIGPAFASGLGIAFAASPFGAAAGTQAAAFDAIFGNSKVAPLKLQSLPDAPDLGKILGAGGDDNLRRIQAATTGLSDIPDGLNYAGEKVPGQKSAVQSSLQNIEANTKATADALSLRRQTTGGGELGNLGVTPAELLGSNATGRSGFNFGASTNDYFAQATELIRRGVEQKSRETVRAATGNFGKASFKPL